MNPFNLSWLDLSDYADRMKIWLSSMPLFFGTISISDYERLRAEFITGMRRAGATDDQLRAGLSEFNRQVLSRDHEPGVPARIVELEQSLAAVFKGATEGIGEGAGNLLKPLIPVLALGVAGLIAFNAIQKRA